LDSSNKIIQDFLDSSQYQIDTILAYEQIYGEDFVSPGGYDLAVEFLLPASSELIQTNEERTRR
jgi:hypothetical protein